MIIVAHLRKLDRHEGHRTVYTIDTVEIPVPVMPATVYNEFLDGVTDRCPAVKQARKAGWEHYQTTMRRE